ncbi:Retrotransposon gag domain [Sesbania bispinosa]|nr:Retrotransposon gag domain [Sesbania bispinosa]
MVTRRNTGRADGHTRNGDETSETTPETDNPVLQRILRRMDQLQEQNQTLQEQNQTLQTQVTTLAKGRAEEDILEADTGEFHPFSTKIAETPYPSDFREPPLKDYDGTTDPQAHVTAFKTQMLKRGIEDAIQCKLFSGTLSGAALIWFSHLPPLSISGISDLVKKFLAQFSARSSRMMTSGKLFSIRQRADESLRDYLGRFNDTSLLVINPNPDLLVSAFEEGADCYIKGEESNAEKRERSNNEGVIIQKADKEQGHIFQQHARKKKGVTTIESSDSERSVIVRPHQVTTARSRDSLRKGRGDKDQRRDEESSGSKRRKEDRHKEGRGKEEVRGVVTTIVGGFTRGGETSSARRRYARQVMTIQTDLHQQGNNHPVIAFTNEDFQGIQPHQDDPMVIDVLMAKYRDSAENHKVFFAELDPRKDFFEKRPQPTEELEEV